MESVCYCLAFFSPILKPSDEEENDGQEPNWEKQEAMVRRLQRKFPKQEKEVNIWSSYRKSVKTFCLFLDLNMSAQLLL